MSLYRFVLDQEAEFPIGVLCRVCEVSRAAYHQWKQNHAAGPTEAELEEAYLVNTIWNIHTESDSTYGSLRITPALRRLGYCTNHKRVERLMRQNGIVGCVPRRSVRTTVQADEHKPLVDLVQRDFLKAHPDIAWCGDITYIRTWEGWLYLATVMDLSSRKIIGYSMTDHLRTSLVNDALDAALKNRYGSTDGVIFHSDRGCQYTSEEFQRLCGDSGIRFSVGRTGICWDNAVAESFFATLKKELVHRRTFHTRAQARTEIFRWIESWYNTRRLHSTLGYMPPIEWEHQHQLQFKTAA